MKLCSSFVAVATCLSVFALHIRPVFSICQSCQVDLDCNFDNNTTDVAIEFTLTICDPEAQVCVAPNSLRGIDCPCSNGEDCQSGRCEGLFGATCQAKLEDGRGCNEDSDCVSGDCNFRFICVSRAEEEPTSAPTAQLRTPSPIDETNNGNDDDDDDSDVGSIAGAIIGAIVIVLLFVCCILCFNKTRFGEHSRSCWPACCRSLCEGAAVLSGPSCEG